MDACQGAHNPKVVGSNPTPATIAVRRPRSGTWAFVVVVPEGESASRGFRWRRPVCDGFKSHHLHTVVGITTLTWSTIASCFRSAATCDATFERPRWWPLTRERAGGLECVDEVG